MDLEKELRKWREKRAQRDKPSFSKLKTQPASSSPAGRRTVRVNGQEVVVVKKNRKALP